MACAASSFWVGACWRPVLAPGPGPPWALRQRKQLGPVRAMACAGPVLFLRSLLTDVAPPRPQQAQWLQPLAGLARGWQAVSLLLSSQAEGWR